MGFMKHVKGLSKMEIEKQHKEYLEARNRLKEAQKPPKPERKRRSSKRKNGKVVTYHIDDLKE